MATGLEHLLDEGIISEVLARLQSGKEAEVFVVRFGDRVVAAKVYKDRTHRSFKNNSSYKEGRAVRNSRSQRAMDKGSKFGKGAAEDAWKSAEADALYRLHAAGVRVPTPVMFIDGVLLMELVLGSDGEPATRLIDTLITPAQANRAYHDMLTQLVRMLSCDLIHGDLSPYNVLWSVNGPTLIDFPQIVSAAQNSGAERFFRRDAENVLGHLARIDRSLAARRGDAAEIWRAYLRRELTPDFVPTGRPSAPDRLPPNRAPAQRDAQNWPPQNRPPQNRPPQNRPPQNRPPQNRPPQNRPPQNRPLAIPGARTHAENPGRQNGASGAARPNGGAPKAAKGRNFAEQRRAPKAPEVLFARPRRPANGPVAPAATPPQSAPREEERPARFDAGSSPRTPRTRR